jgi:hypothetical protein
MLESSVAQGNHLADAGTSGNAGCCKRLFLNVMRELRLRCGPSYRATVCGEPLATGSARGPTFLGLK